MSVHIDMASFEPRSRCEDVVFFSFVSSSSHNERSTLTFAAQVYILFPPHLISPIRLMRAVGMRYEPGLVAVALFTPPALYGSPQLRQDLPQTSSMSGFLSQPRSLGMS